MLPKRFDRVACVGSPEDYDLNKDFSLFARNRGFNFRVFENFDEAIQWLEGNL
jgi:hypothetical protein